MKINPIPQFITLEKDQNNSYASSLHEDNRTSFLRNEHKWVKITYHKEHSPLWRLGMGLVALFATLGTCFMGPFFSENIKNLWLKALAGREIFIVEMEDLSSTQETVNQLFTQQISIASQEVEPTPPVDTNQQGTSGDIQFPPIFNYQAEIDDPLHYPVFLLFSEARQKKAEGLRPEEYLPSGMDQASFDLWVEKFNRFKYYMWLGKDLLPNLEEMVNPAVVNSQGACAYSKKRYADMLERKKNPPDYHEFKNCPTFEKLVEDVTKRLEQYDLPLEMKKRMEALEPTLPGYFKLITMPDFEASWNESALRIALLTHEEFESLTLEQLKNLNPRQKEFVEQRLKIRETSQIEVKEEAYLNFNSLTLSELRSLNPAILNTFIQNLDSVLLDYIKPSQLKGLDLKQLSDGKFHDFFKDPNSVDPHFQNQPLRMEIDRKTCEKIRSLNVNQINEIWDRLTPRLISFIPRDILNKIDNKEQRLAAVRPL